MGVTQLDIRRPIFSCLNTIVRLAVGPVVSIMCRSLYDCIKAAKYWSSYIKLSDLGTFQLQWWLDNLPSLDGYPICQDSSVLKFEFSVSEMPVIGDFLCIRLSPSKGCIQGLSLCWSLKKVLLSRN